jgi:phosphatidylserine synthase
VTWKAELPQGFGATSSLFIPAATILCAFAMVGRIRYPHFVNRYLRGRKSLGAVATATVVVAVSVWWFHEALAAAMTGYALSGPLGAAFRRRTDAVAGTDGA